MSLAIKTNKSEVILVSHVVTFAHFTCMELAFKWLRKSRSGTMLSSCCSCSLLVLPEKTKQCPSNTFQRLPPFLKEETHVMGYIPVIEWMATLERSILNCMFFSLDLPVSWIFYIRSSRALSLAQTVTYTAELTVQLSHDKKKSHYLPLIWSLLLAFWKIQLASRIRLIP